MATLSEQKSQFFVRVQEPAPSASDRGVDMALQFCHGSGWSEYPLTIHEARMTVQALNDAIELLEKD